MIEPFQDAVSAGRFLQVVAVRRTLDQRHDAAEVNHDQVRIVLHNLFHGKQHFRTAEADVRGVDDFHVRSRVTAFDRLFQIEGEEGVVVGR
jgi:hypothetical protein